MRCQHLFLPILVATLGIDMRDETIGAQSARHVLTSVEQNIDVRDWQITGSRSGVAADIPWSVRRQRLHGGKQDGVDLVIVDNGRMTITLVPTRGMGILHVVSGGL